ncbi:uncharacterized protein PV09_09766 [Verruconis gallopava]|uniref:CCHC-type domain-containing protein n=1 Tax=Verruconis gallopava TaxID=253628 RepID=A0A0D1X8R1_9PEZI|nr:uncharacterized protein PV09_09766 [Verruconis gallopava]KIV98410.1 hypothetical protein PV09_09766 [Verruconis gallopava]
MAYQRAEQRPGQTTQQFYQYLLSLERQLSEDFSENQQRFHLLARLRPELRDQLNRYQDIPKTCESIVALATRLEGLGKKRVSSNTDNGTTRKTQRLDSDNTYDTKSASDHHKTGSYTQGSSQAQTPGHSQTLYFICKDPGHLAQDCRKAGTTQPGASPDNQSGKD